MEAQVLDNKLTRLKELIETKEKVDAEIEALLGAPVETPKRGRPRKPNGEGSAANPEADQAMGGQQELRPELGGSTFTR